MIDVEIKLKPVARLVKILGEHLIRDNTTGVLELIKNGYDADAASVTVELKNLANPETTEVVIQDDGDGMDEKILTGPWSEPAHGSKEAAKEKLERTKKGRLPLGEKGVGRFAAQRLGKNLELVTRPEGHPFEYILNIDWEKFDSTSSYIDQISFPLEKREPKVFTGNKHGTRIVVRGARTPWTQREVANLQAHLIKLLSPSREKKDFSVSLKCEEYPELESLEASDILQKYQFKIECSIDAKGSANYMFYHRKPDGTLERREAQLNLWANVIDDWQKFDPQCGPLNIVIHAWLKVAKNLKQYEVTKQQLKTLGGVSIYRDGFRVIPYGDEDDDWLGLDRRRVQRPGEAYDSDQVLGRIEITQQFNSNLIDKTSREGLQENQAYFDMKGMVLAVMTLLESESSGQRSAMKPATESKKNLEKQLEALKKEIDEIKSSSTSSESVEHPPVSESESKKSENNSQEQKTVAVPVAKLDQLKDRTEEIEKVKDEVFREMAESKEEQREAFLHLVGIGLAAERFAHEFDRSVGALSANLKRLEEIRPFDRNVKALRLIFDTLKNEIAVVSAGRYVRRTPESEEFNVNEIIEVVLSAHTKELQDFSIKVDHNPNDGFSIKMPKSSLSQVIDNVVANAIHWLNGKSEANARNLSISVNKEERSIVICNDGPKIQPHIKRGLFHSYFVSSKPEGRGLGLYISHEIMKRNNGIIELLDESSPENKYGGAAFKISFE